MKYSTMMLVAFCAACGSDLPSGIQLEGIPVPEAAVLDVAARFKAVAGFTGALNGTVDFRPPSDFVECSLSVPEKCPHEFGPPAAFSIVSDWRGLEHVHESSLTHELIHAVYGDVGHDRAELWAYPDGLMWRFNARLAAEGR